jgi:hypothetical protein
MKMYAFYHNPRSESGMVVIMANSADEAWHILWEKYSEENEDYIAWRKENDILSCSWYILEESDRFLTCDGH